MKKVILAVLLVSNFAVATPKEPLVRILCHDRFENEIWEMTGERYDDTGCKAMLIAGTVGMCFEGDAQKLVDQMNRGDFKYSNVQKVNENTAQLIHPDVIRYGSYEGDFVGWTRTDNELFRCPEFDMIKAYTTQLADDLKSSVEYAVSRRYHEEFGLPFWIDSPAENQAL